MVMIRSRFIIIAAVSANGRYPASGPSLKCSTAGRSASCSTPKPVCRLIRRTPGKRDSGAKAVISNAAGIEKLHFNVCVAHIYEFANTLNEVIGDADSEDGSVATDFTWAMREAADVLVQLFAPMMPHLAEECWATLGHDTLVAQAPWPAVERNLLIEDTITLPVQVNGRKRAEVIVPRDAANAQIEAAVLALDAVQKALDGKSPKKVIVVPQRIVNVVA